MSQTRSPLRRLRCAASSASTIASELMSSTNVLTDVNGMFRISRENGPTTLSCLYTMYVEINDPKNSVSEPRNTQKPTLNVLRPVAVGGCAAACASANCLSYVKLDADAGADAELLRLPHQLAPLSSMSCTTLLLFRVLVRVHVQIRLVQTPSSQSQSPSRPVRTAVPTSAAPGTDRT